MNRDELLKRLSAIEFYLIDLHLFLNTHPTDREAIMQYNTMVEEAKKLRAEYERQYGMLLQNNSESGYPWQWIDNPWPWQKQFNFELGGDDL